ncbi:MAG: endolytic transglycosylase MltG [Patescibacteria group bacterium]|nr:endolytic transglycosylase MltG [Patescibacteria group bacterium]
MKKNSLVVFLSLVTFSLIFLGGILGWLWAVSPAGSSQSTEKFVVNKGESLSQISQRLKIQGLIREPLSFKVIAFIQGKSKKIQAGYFSLSPSMSAFAIIEALTHGSLDKKVTLIEGLRQEQVAQILLKEGFKVDLLAWSQAIKQENLEGRIFPDTYFFAEGADEKTILKIISQNFEKKVRQGLAVKFSKTKLNLADILTLASIVEREARGEADQRLVAGILFKRLQKGWPLQVDATVQYAVASQNSKLKTQNFNDWWPKSLTRNDLEINSAYNTYKNLGLPPGPICNPGLSAIKAVLEPQSSSYWYYLSDEKGIMHYANTDEEQAGNIGKYLR